MWFGVNPLKCATEALQDKLIPGVILLKQIEFILRVVYVQYTFIVSFTHLPFIHLNGISVCCKQSAYWKKTGNVHCEEH